MPYSLSSKKEVFSKGPQFKEMGLAEEGSPFAIPIIEGGKEAETSWKGAVSYRLGTSKRIVRLSQQRRRKRGGTRQHSLTSELKKRERGGGNTQLNRGLRLLQGTVRATYRCFLVRAQGHE